jgi:hypothetical protein
VLKGAEMRNRSEQEVAGYRDALALIHEHAADMPLEPRLLLQLHQRLTSYATGRSGVWKSTNNEIQERDANGQVPRAGKRQLAREASLRQLVSFSVSSIEQECPGITPGLVRDALAEGETFLDLDIIDPGALGRLLAEPIKQQLPVGLGH